MENELRSVRSGWSIAAGLIAWLIGILTPAIAFDVELSIKSDAGTQYRAYFQIMATVLFIFTWRWAQRSSNWLLGLILAISAALFVIYGVIKDEWTCTYLDSANYIIGSELRPNAAAIFETRDLVSRPCIDQLAPFGGDAALVWVEQELFVRFLSLFGLYSAAWFSLALVVICAAKRAGEGMIQDGQKK
ncbi:hypothetical protein INR77_04240 [Erythrobacter sp. SCSIO 43205]|uniref:hypothetical protein n=1 Tax=Erythrobacter sp. SCSIO 43205 TaxID=2779361 RepID=UPI001CAA0931|nr:hypothetical protein [Erythrobacter sp. SCSIO 43205]UAB78917.1 hypothetical protein INR77_04240 [Erythrobacter sp. SCSIO 43205]